MPYIKAIQIQGKIFNHIRPNHYSVNPLDKPTGYKFSKSNRKPLYQPSIAPDPGVYENKIQAFNRITFLGNFTSYIFSCIYYSKRGFSKRY